SSYQSFLAAREAAESAKLSFDFAQKGFDAGKVTVYDLNSSRNHYFTAQAQMVQAKYSFLFKLKIMNFYQGLPLSGK
ncbi:MAG: TolC family protein, partial [Flavobacteriaceae bacterium]|nr:TolC family protein [Flavobacteriaceae bacterium]